MSGPPPPPPPHGGVPKGSGLPPGKYDIFVIPEHSAGSGFLYLPSLQPNTNSFAAGFASALLLVALFQSMAPAFRAWWDQFQGIGNAGILMVIAGVGFGAWALGRTQQEGGGGGKSGPKPSFSSGGGHPGAQGWGSQQGAGPDAGPQGPPPPPPPHNDGSKSPPPKPEQPNGSWQRPPDPAAEEEAARKAQQEKEAREAKAAQEEKERKEAEERAAREAKAKEERLKAEKAAAEKAAAEKAAAEKAAAEKAAAEKAAADKAKAEAARAAAARGSWEKAREETRKREEERKAKEAETKRREEAAKRLAELRAKEARERQEREAKKAKEEAEKAKTAEATRKAAEAKTAELRATAAAVAKAAEEKRKKEEAEKAAAAAKAEAASKRGSSYAYSGVGEKTSMWPNGRPPSVPSHASSTPRPPPSSPGRKPPAPTAKTYLSTEEEEAHSYRPYDKPKRSHRTAPSVSSFSGSEASWAQSQTTAKTSPPASFRGPYSTKDPDKIVVSGVYLFMSQFAKEPASQLLSGVGTVTDGLILRITTEGLFIDDDVRGVPQREWDVKAWTLSKVDVWCPPHCLSNPSVSSAAPKTAPGLLHKMAGTSKAARAAAANKGVLNGEEADAWLAEMLKECKDCCRLGDCEDKIKQGGWQIPGGDAWRDRCLHVLRATVRDQDGKRYLFVVEEEEGWKLAVGLQRLRRGTQVRQLGVSGMGAADAKATLDLLGYQ